MEIIVGAMGFPVEWKRTLWPKNDSDIGCHIASTYINHSDNLVASGGEATSSVLNENMQCLRFLFDQAVQRR